MFELYYAMVNIVDYLALNDVSDDIEYIDILNKLTRLESERTIETIEDFMESFADANDCGPYLDRNNIEIPTWRDIVKAFRELFERGDRIEVCSES